VDSIASARPLSALLLQSGSEGEFLVAEADVATVERFLSLPEVQQAMPRNTELRWGSEPRGRGAQLYRSLYVLESRPFMTGEVLEDAQPGRDPQFGQTIVSFQLNRTGARIFERVTSQ